jgi:hypothetical protein
MSLMNSIFGGSQADYEEHLRQRRRVDAERLKQQYAAQQGLGGMKQKLPRFNPNKSEAFQVPLSQLVTLWRLKHGEEWYDAGHSRPEPGKNFYVDAFDRLRNAGCFESFDGWHRLKEDV